jgi:hypothetical protein
MTFHEFRERLVARCGSEAAGARHEIFFIMQRRSWLPAALRGLLAAMRDAWLCLRLPAAAPLSASVVVVASRRGASGLEALRPLLRSLDENRVPWTLVVHPRLRHTRGARPPARPAARAWRHAAAAFGMRLDMTGAEAFVVRCGLFRLRLWRGAWAATLSGGQGGLVLHNDFELFAVAAIEAGAGRWDSLCVQHGLPTDEFFPTRARLQLVWGETSRTAYARRGTAPTALLVGPKRSWPRAEVKAPVGIRLVSQTHTPVYGRSLAPDFLALAEAIHKRFPDPDRFAILLHPEEIRLGHPYRKERLTAVCRTPPHAELREGGRPALLVGFSSTALVEAACRGHLVIGMAWEVPASQAALTIGRPPLTAPDAETLGPLLDRLLGDPSALAGAMAQQEEWLGRTFASGEAWLTELRRWQ